MIRLLLLVLLATQAAAATLEVGPERKLNSPAAALALAGDGDTILIDEGEYYECLRIGGDHLTIQGRGAGAVFTDTTCDGKAIIIAQGERITLRNLTLQRARVKDGNGAGIRAEGGALDIDKVRFLNNQAGLVIGHNPAAIVTVRDSQFTDTGRCDAGKCAPAITAGVISRLRLEHTRLSGTAGAHQVVSAAASTEIISSLIEDGPRGSASFQLIISAGGSLLLEDSVIQKGPRATNLRAAILLDGTMGGPFSFNNNRNGGYLQLAYRPSHVANGFVKNFEPVFRFDKMNQARTLTGTDETRYTVGLNYWLGSSTVFKTAYEFDRQSGRNADPHNSVLVQFVTGF